MVALVKRDHPAAQNMAAVPLSHEIRAERSRPWPRCSPRWPSTRFTADHAKRYVDKVHAQHRRGEAPPGQIDTAKVDWSGVGAR